MCEHCKSYKGYTERRSQPLELNQKYIEDRSRYISGAIRNSGLGSGFANSFPVKSGIDHENQGGCCSWRQSCCGGGCCSRTPNCCLPGDESVSKPQYYNGQPGMGYGLAMAYGYGMRMGQMMNGVMSMAPDRIPCPSSEGRPKCYGGDCGGSLSEESSKIEIQNGLNNVKQDVRNGQPLVNGLMDEGSVNGIKQEPANGVKEELANGVNEELANEVKQEPANGDETQ